MLERQRRQLADRPSLRVRARPPEKGRRRLRERSTLEVHERVETRHRRVVDAAAEPALEGHPGPREARGERATRQQDGRVVGEEAAIIGEQDQVEPYELAI